MDFRKKSSLILIQLLCCVFWFEEVNPAAVEPLIRSEPRNGIFIGKVGERASLWCNITQGDPTPTVTWRKEGNCIIGSGEELKFEKLTMEDQGSYCCIANNSAGNRHVLFRVKIYEYSEELGNFSGGLVGIRNLHGRNGYYLTWYHTIVWPGFWGDYGRYVVANWDVGSGRSFSSKDGYNMDSSTGDLLIDPLRPAHEGEYTAAMFYADEEESYSYAYLHVYVPPSRMVMKDMDLPVVVGEDKTITCTIPLVKPENITFEWSLSNNGTIVSGTTQSYSMNLDGTFHVTSTFKHRIKRSDDGHWLNCKAKHGIDPSRYAQDQKKITVHYFPVWGGSSKVQSSALGVTNTLICDVESAPPVLVYNWKFEGKDLRETGRILVLRKVTRRDLGWYICKAQNTLGRRAFNITLQESGSPSPPKNFTVISHTSRTLLVKWRITYNGGFNLEKFELVVNDSMTETTHDVYFCSTRQDCIYRIKGLLPQTAYWLKVRAKNTWRSKRRSYSQYVEIFGETLEQPQLIPLAPEVEEKSLFIKWLYEPRKRERHPLTSVYDQKVGLVVVYKKAGDAEFTKYPAEGKIPVMDQSARIEGSFNPSVKYYIAYKLYEGDEEALVLEPKMVPGVVEGYGSGNMLHWMIGGGLVSALILLAVTTSVICKYLDRRERVQPQLWQISNELILDFNEPMDGPRPYESLALYEDIDFNGRESIVTTISQRVTSENTTRRPVPSPRPQPTSEYLQPVGVNEPRSQEQMVMLTSLQLDHLIATSVSRAVEEGVLMALHKSQLLDVPKDVAPTPSSDGATDKSEFKPQKTKRAKKAAESVL